jgi:hypothetical protein
MNPEDDLPIKNPDIQMEDIEILEFASEIYPDHRRVKVNFLLSPFQTNPNASLALFSPEGEKLASVNIVNIFSPANEITLHVPANQNSPGVYRIEMDLFYLREEESPGPESNAISLSTVPIKSKTTSFSLL